MQSSIRFCITMFMLATLAATANAGNFVVSVFTDTNAGTPPGSGVGSAGDLRDAIIAANTAGGVNTITFAGGPATITLQGPLPAITTDLTIDGGTPGTVTIDGADLYRVFFVDTGTVVLKNLKIQNAKARGGAGGTGDGGGGGGAGLGAGLFVNKATASVTVSHVDFITMSAVGGAGGNFISHTPAGGGGGGLGGNGGITTVNGGGTGGGGVLGAGANTTTTNGGTGGLGGGGGGGLLGAGVAGTGGAAYAGNTAGGNAVGTAGGAGGFGGGGGGAALGIGGVGGFGGGGGGTGQVGAGGAGGPGGGGGGTDGNPTSALGGSLGSGVSGGNGGKGPGSGGGGGAAAGPVIFINLGAVAVDLATVTSTGHTATGGARGTSQAGNLTIATAGTASSAPIFNYGGTFNGLATTGPIFLAPTVTGVAPASGLTVGGTSVVITGTGYLGATAVKFGADNAASFVIDSDTQITATSPAAAAGTVDITIVSPNGTSTPGAADQFTFNLAPQTITFSSLAAKTSWDADADPGASASSGLAVSYTSSDPAVATIAGGKIHVVGRGTSTITASQAGNTMYLAAPPVSQTLTVVPAMVLSALSDGATTTGSTINISGTVSTMGGISSVTANSATIQFNQDGSFSCPLQLLAGANTITVVATNSTGLTTTDTRSINLDSTAPLLMVTTPPDNSIACQNAIIVTGTIADPALAVTYSVNGATVQTASLTGTAFSFPASLNTGMNSITVFVADGAGRQAEVKRTVTYQAAFSIAITDPATDVRLPLDSYLLSGTVTDNTTPVSVTITIGDQSFTPAVTNGAFQQKLSFTEEKTYQIRINGVDQNSNSLTVQRNIIHTMPKATAGVAGTFSIVDALQALRMTVGSVIPANDQVLRMDVAPMVNGLSVGNGKIDLEDTIVILRMAVGLL